MNRIAGCVSSLLHIVGGAMTRPYSLALMALLSLHAWDANAASFDNRYRVHTGQLNGDGQTDLYLRHSPSLVMIDVGGIIVPIATSRRTLGQFALVNQGNGTFSATPLTGQQVQTVNSWPVQQVDADARDINFDGNVDLQLSGVGAVIGGTPDQLVFAPPSEGALPQAVVAMTANRRTFVNDVYASMLDPYYFLNNAPWVLTGVEPINRFWYASVTSASNLDLINQFLTDCGTNCVASTNDPPVCFGTYAAYDDAGNFIGNVQANLCLSEIHIYYYDVQVQRERDYSVFNADAISFANALWGVSPNGVDGVIGADPSVEPYRTLNRVLAEILRGVFGTASIEEEPSEPTPDYYTAICNTLGRYNNFDHAPFPLDDTFDPHAISFHHFDQLTIACAAGEYECSVGRLANSVLPRYSFPSKRLKDQLTPLDGSSWQRVYMAGPLNLTDPDSYTLTIGWVTQTQLLQGNWFGAIQNVTTPAHWVYPGTISRTITTSPLGNPRFFTHGIGINQAGTIQGIGLNIPPLQWALGCGNDLFGPTVFRTLDKQAIRYWSEHYNQPVLPATEPAALKPTS